MPASSWTAVIFAASSAAPLGEVGEQAPQVRDARFGPVGGLPGDGFADEPEYVVLQHSNRALRNSGSAL